MNQVDLVAPDIARWRNGNTGIAYVHSFEAARGGPHVLVTGLVHGNEICGAIALDRLLGDGLRPARGRLTFAFVNVAAYQRFDPGDPNASRYVDEDFNRLWSPDVLDGPRASVELERARELRPLVDSADLLLDLHSLQHDHDPLLLCGRLEKGRALARRVGYPAIVIADAGHAAGTRLRDYGGFGDPQSAKNALLVECGQHWVRGSDAVALAATLRFLTAASAIDEAVPRADRGADCAEVPTRPQRFIEVTGAVTVETEDFVFAGPYRGLEVIAKAGSEIARDGARPVLTPYDDCILVMPSQRLERGQTAVRFGRWADH
jgi:predicted deacylase